MKKILSVFLAALMLCSALSVIAFAEEKYPAPAEPANLSLTPEGVASWDAVAVPDYADVDGFETTCEIEYKVTLSRWDYDDKANTWSFTQVGDAIVTADTSVDFSSSMVSGKYIFAVTATAQYTRTKESDGTSSTFKRVGKTAAMEKEDAVQVTNDIFADPPINDDVPFESLVKEDQKTANYILKIIKKIKEVISIFLRFLGYAGDVTGITDDIMNK